MGGLPLGAIIFPLTTPSRCLDMAVGLTCMHLVAGTRVCKGCTEKYVCNSYASLGVAETACFVFVTVSRYTVNDVLIQCGTKYPLVLFFLENLQ